MPDGRLDWPRRGLGGRTGLGDRRRRESAQPRDHTIGDVQIPVGGDDPAALRLHVKNQRVVILGPDVVQDLVDLVHDRLDQLILTSLHAAEDVLVALLEVGLLLPDRLLPRISRSAGVRVPSTLA